jgi:hypothetical protein
MDYHYPLLRNPLKLNEPMGVLGKIIKPNWENHQTKLGGLSSQPCLITTGSILLAIRIG